MRVIITRAITKLKQKIYKHDLKKRGWDKSPQSQKEKSKLIQSILIVLVCFFSILCSTGYHQFSEINRHQS